MTAPEPRATQFVAKLGHPGLGCPQAKSLFAGRCGG
jgi:hypothetical protein